jgi:hypothetical protein
MIFDIETTGLLPEMDRVHTMHCLNTEDGTRMRFNDGKFADGSTAPRDGTLEEGFRLLMEQDRLIGHNIIRFDIPAIQKIYPWFRVGRNTEIRDTLVMTKLRWPNLGEIDKMAIKKGKRPPEFPTWMTGRHSLKAWGLRLGVLKKDYEGVWHSFTQEMEEYAAQDPVTNKALWDKCMEHPVAAEAEELEQRVQHLIAMQVAYGFEFDVAAAEDLERILRGRKAELMDELREAFPPWYEPVKKKGEIEVFVPKANNRKLGYTKGVPLTKTKLVSFNPGSRVQIANRLRTLYEWQPIEFTDSGQPKVDETTLASLDHIPQAATLIDYLTVDKRLGQLAEGDKAWLKYVKEDGRIHGDVDPLGAITRRMTHSKPNVAQVPSIVNAKGLVPYGAESRRLFKVKPGYQLGGCDAEGLELRMLAHYMAKHDNGDYGKAVVDGKKEDGTDVHTVNQKLIRLNSRNSAKTWIYAYLYGAGLLKLGMVIYEDMTAAKREAFNAKYEAGSVREKALARLGQQARKRVEEGLPALGKLQDSVKRLAKKNGKLPALDGSFLKVRSQHSALNTLLQGNGAIIMKKALVILADWLMDDGWEPNWLTGEWVRGEDVMGFTANVHDEFQMEIPKHLVDEIGEKAKASIKEAGVQYGVRCPLAGSFDAGDSWADSH